MKRLYATIHCGKPVGIYERDHERLLIKYENPDEDSTFSLDYGCHGEIKILSEYIRVFLKEIEPYHNTKREDYE